VVERKLSDDLNYLEFWAEGFGNAGVKSLLLDTVAPFLSYRASQYLEGLTGGTARVEFVTQKTLSSGDRRDKMEVRASYAFGGGQYQAVSDGEKRRIDLSSLLALGDLGASPSVAPITITLTLRREPWDAIRVGHSKTSGDSLSADH